MSIHAILARQDRLLPPLLSGPHREASAPLLDGMAQTTARPPLVLCRPGYLAGLTAGFCSLS